MQSMTGQDALTRASLLAQASFYGAQTEQSSYDRRQNQMHWAPHPAHPGFAQNQAPPNPFAPIAPTPEVNQERSNGILTRRQRAAIAQIQNAPPQVCPHPTGLIYIHAFYCSLLAVSCWGPTLLPHCGLWLA